MTKYPFRCSVGHKFEIISTLNGVPQLGCKTCSKTQILTKGDSNA
jgi:hypothetical protein